MDEIDALQQQAIEAAMQLQWQDAANLNAQIIKKDKHNLSAYLRIGFAYLQLGKINVAKKYYNKALKIQPKNIVALENLDKIKVLGRRGLKKTIIDKPIFNSEIFIDVPGKTKSLTLVNPGQKNVLAKLVSGQNLDLKVKKRKVEARTTSSEYVGTLPDDISRRLIHFLKARSVYSTIIKEASLNKIVVFIKEEKKGRGVVGHISFPHSIPKTQFIYNGDDDKSSESEDDATPDEDVVGWEKVAQEVNVEEKEIGIEIPDEESDDNNEE